MKREQDIEKLLQKLNQKCLQCVKQNTPSHERCDYYCTVGKKIHELDRQNTKWAQSEEYQKREHPWI